MHAATRGLIPHLETLADDLCTAVLAWRAGQIELEMRPQHQGVGDVSFAPDEVAEQLLEAWLAKQAAASPLSLFTEDLGWRHRGPDGAGGSRELADFGHGGPRVVIDPIDGTRPWLHGLRSAWTVVAVAGPGGGLPRMAEVEWGLVAELPLAAGHPRRVLGAGWGEGAWLDAGDGRTPLRCPDRAAVDHAFFSFFAYHPAVRAPIDAIAWRFFERLERLEGAQVDHCYDDQYIASGGQLALLALGHYAMAADLRPWVVGLNGAKSQCAKAYDIAGAVLVAREAGCEVLSPDGSQLDFALDGEGPVGFVAYPGLRSRERLHPHFGAMLAESGVSRRPFLAT